jgi:hypothetical protein
MKDDRVQNNNKTKFLFLKARPLVRIKRKSLLSALTARPLVIVLTARPLVSILREMLAAGSLNS